jgi:hypothetical protein
MRGARLDGLTGDRLARPPAARGRRAEFSNSVDNGAGSGGAEPCQRPSLCSSVLLAKLWLLYALHYPPVCKGEIWRVQIVWPNGTVHHVGKFASEKDAANWITAHSHLTMPVKESNSPRAEDVQTSLARD